MKLINVTVAGLFQVDVYVNDPTNSSEVVEATAQTLVSLNATLASQHTDICPIFFTNSLDISDLHIAVDEEEEIEES